MRVLKFKDSVEKFHKGEIVLRPRYATGSDGLYLLVEDIPLNAIQVKVFFIGTISHREIDRSKFASLVFNTKDKKATYIRTNYDGYLSFRKLKQDEKELIFDALTDNKYYNPDYYLGIVKNATGLDIRKLYKKEYDEYILKKDINKYNL